jgi:hypothetical protein
MFFEVLNCFGIMGAAQDTTNEIVSRGFTECQITTVSTLNGTVDLNSGIPFVDVIVFVDATPQEIMEETNNFLNS